MYKAIDARPLPLWVWGVCFLLLMIPAAYYFLFVMGFTPPSKEFTEFNLNRLVSDESSGEQLQVVMFGDSRLRYATLAEEDLGSKLSDELGRAVSVRRIVKDIAVFEDFSGLTETVLELRPDLVVIQEDLLSKERSTYSQWFFSRKYLESLFFGAFSDKKGRDQEKQQVEMSCDALSINETVEQRRAHFLKWARFGDEAQFAPGVAGFLKQAAAKGIVIRGISIPISPRGMASVPPPNELPLVEVGNTSQEFMNNEYCDVVHMNESGREVYSKWLVTFLASEINSQIRKS
ncbi:hypothetical protein [Microbulbifer hydrolyticus]|uniref:SGNH/GDSL hydrolase family protein n=1 Tax=Microbulbifer hydrolyticus TaxID=48074 RepID=A0A6P1TCS1_9GAMM|nr:hypothetical protein [Microbulbifer hydrolyticus]MBB5212114.1 hypothetical protein [Microbulbifer hydrolyticus]QHQ39787.1 hypothetical protein GTQ55_12865 [Microbulbifer hydrolyticus]